MSTRRSTRRALAPTPTPTPTFALALTLAVAFVALGLALRRAVPVAPVDESYRDVVRYYRALERP